jgi:hypothetical protein
VEEANMSSRVVYTFYLPAGWFGFNTTGSVFIHGYANNKAVNYCAIIYPTPFDPLVGDIEGGGPVIITQGETFRHIDGTVARKVRVQNLDMVNNCRVDIVETVDIVES